MKKVALLGLVCASMFGGLNAAAQEVSYVEDCSQGRLLAPARANWFITAQGGASAFFSNHDRHITLRKRIGSNAEIFAGKWFTPVWGFRFGASGQILRGATHETGAFRDPHSGIVAEGSWGEHLYGERVATLGPEIDLMLNLTNWWCGYNPERVYNAVLHVGGGGYWTFRHNGEDHKWHNAHNRTLFATAGLQNNFALNKHIDLFIDVTATVMDYSSFDRYDIKADNKDMTLALGANFGITYHFSPRGWNCPVTAVCPTWKYTDAEGDELVAQLDNANRKIGDLQRQLDDCLNRPQQDCDCVNALATIYYPINVSTMSNREVTLVQSMAKTMLANPDKKYILTGWADNYTGNDAINTRLRHQRVDGVYDCLIKAGVPAAQLEKRIDANNLTDYGLKGAQFDRAVTIIEAK
ncbi:MAG: hypothetical protein K2M14_07870 [Muribaculaceae bacterium]|nr:hypothetical protein [Muribaculaceae bacterium]